MIKYVAAGKTSRVWKGAASTATWYTTVIRGTPFMSRAPDLYTIPFVFYGGLYACIVGYGINSGA
jgi:ABC-type arginine transport system permease subunit